MQVEEPVVLHIGKIQIISFVINVKLCIIRALKKGSFILLKIILFGVNLKKEKFVKTVLDLREKIKNAGVDIILKVT